MKHSVVRNDPSSSKEQPQQQQQQRSSLSSYSSPKQYHNDQFHHHPFIFIRYIKSIYQMIHSCTHGCTMTDDEYHHYSYPCYSNTTYTMNHDDEEEDDTTSISYNHDDIEDMTNDDVLLRHHIKKIHDPTTITSQFFHGMDIPIIQSSSTVINRPTTITTSATPAAESIGTMDNNSNNNNNNTDVNDGDDTNHIELQNHYQHHQFISRHTTNHVTLCNDQSDTIVSNNNNNHRHLPSNKLSSSSSNNLLHHPDHHHHHNIYTMITELIQYMETNQKDNNHNSNNKYHIGYDVDHFNSDNNSICNHSIMTQQSHKQPVPLWSSTSSSLSSQQQRNYYHSTSNNDDILSIITPFCIFHDDDDDNDTVRTVPHRHNHNHHHYPTITTTTLAPYLPSSTTAITPSLDQNYVPNKLATTTKDCGNNNNTEQPSYDDDWYYTNWIEMNQYTIDDDNICYSHDSRWRRHSCSITIKNSQEEPTLVDSMSSILPLSKPNHSCSTSIICTDSPYSSTTLVGGTTNGQHDSYFYHSTSPTNIPITSSVLSLSPNLISSSSFPIVTKYIKDTSPDILNCSNVSSSSSLNELLLLPKLHSTPLKNYYYNSIKNNVTLTMIHPKYKYDIPYQYSNYYNNNMMMIMDNNNNNKSISLKRYITKSSKKHNTKRQHDHNIDHTSFYMRVEF